MDENPKVSVIIPIYNVGNFLEETLTCLQMQTFHEFEVILVDDGSTDKSKEICKRFAELDSRFKYYYQNNCGASAARNNGIRNATGKYICFMDADDLCEIKWIESMYNAISNTSARIAMLGWKVINEKHETIDIIHHNDYLLHAEDALSVLTSLGGSVWNKIFERDLIVSDAEGDSILFDEEQTFSEDILFCIMALCKAKEMQMSSKGGYIYRNHSGSVSHQIGVKQIERYENMLRGQKKMVEFIEKNMDAGVAAAHKFYCSSNFYAMLDLYIAGIRDKSIYKKYSTAILNDKYATEKIRVLSKCILLFPNAIFKLWILLREIKKLFKKIAYMQRNVNGKA